MIPMIELELKEKLGSEDVNPLWFTYLKMSLGTTFKLPSATDDDFDVANKESISIYMLNCIDTND